jgi:predicted nucleotidyltransferase component of viral defense system
MLIYNIRQFELVLPTIPIAMKLRRRTHMEVAQAQDLMVLGTFDVFPAAVIHGGTAIWRCYGGNRFSEDVDFYLPPSARRRTGVLSEDFTRKGLAEQKLRETSNSVYARFGSGASSVRFEASFRKVTGVVVRRYEMVDGSFATARTLSPESMLAEKAGAYLGRRKVRDIYDVFFLVHIADRTAPAVEAVRRMLSRFAPPTDERSLRAVVIAGSATTIADMMEEIGRWAK